MKTLSRRIFRWGWRYGVMLVLAGFIAYKLATVWIPLWINAGDMEGVQVAHLTVQDQAGNDVPLATFRGAPLILNFWATWCMPCRVEIPLLASAFPDLKEQGKQLLGINLRESWSTIAAFREEVDMPYPIYRDDGSLAEALGIGLLPAIVVISAEGRVESIVYGFRPWVGWYLEWWI